MPPGIPRAWRGSSPPAFRGRTAAAVPCLPRRPAPGRSRCRRSRPGGDAEKGHRKTAERRRKDQPPLRLRGRPALHPPPGLQRAGREEGTEGAAADPAGDHHPPGMHVGHDGRSRAEIGVVARKPERRKARDDHGHQDRAVGARRIGAPHFLDREDDAGERRVEGRRNARGRARKDQAARMRQPAPARRLQHDRGAHLHRRPLAPDGGAAEEAEDREQHLAHGKPQRQKPPARLPLRQVPPGNGLRNAAALRIRKEPEREKRRKRKARRRQQKRQIPRQMARPRQRAKQMLRIIGRLSKPDTHHPDRQRPRPEHHPRPPHGERHAKHARTTKQAGLAKIRSHDGHGLPRDDGKVKGAGQNPACWYSWKSTAYRSLTAARGFSHGTWLERASMPLPRMWSAAFSPVMMDGLLRLP